jgi:PAS domain-containing protein
MDVARLTTYVNPSWCHISGLSFQEALGMVGLMQCMMMIKQQLLMVGKMKPLLIKKLMSEYRFMRPDGKIAWVMGQSILR